MRKQDRKLFNVFAVVYCTLVLLALCFPYWIVLFIMGALAGLGFAPVALWLGSRDMTLPKLRRVSFSLLAVWFLVGTSIVLAKAIPFIGKQGWFSRVH